MAWDGDARHDMARLKDTLALQGIETLHNVFGEYVAVQV